MQRSGTKVVGVELVDGTDLGRGRHVRARLQREARVWAGPRGVGGRRGRGQGRAAKGGVRPKT